MQRRRRKKISSGCDETAKAASTDLRLHRAFRSSGGPGSRRATCARRRLAGDASAIASGRKPKGINFTGAGTWSSGSWPLQMLPTSDRCLVEAPGESVGFEPF